MTVRTPAATTKRPKGSRSIVKAEKAAKPRTTRKGAASDPFVAAVAAYLTGPTKKRQELFNRVAQAFYVSSRVKKIAAFYANANSLTNQEDEIIQEVAVLLYEKVLPVLDKAENVYTMLSAVTKRTSLGLTRTLLSHSKRYTSLDGLRDQSDDAGGDEGVIELDDGQRVNADDGFMDRVDHELTKKALFQEVNRRVERDDRLRHLVTLADGISKSSTFPLVSPVEPIERPSIKRDARKDKTKMPPSSIELAEIRRTLNMSIGKFAELLNLGDKRNKGKMTSYLYGRVKKVPDDVMAKAREHLANRGGGSAYAQAEATFGTREMSEIVLAWAQQMFIAGDNIVSGVAAQLGISQVTVKRWLSNKHRPSIEELQKLADKVKTKAAEARNNILSQAGEPSTEE